MALRKMGEGKATERIDAFDEAVIDYPDAAGYAREIAKLWADAQRKFLAIGRYLVRAKATLPHGEYEAMISNSLPFGLPTARKLKAVAEAVTPGRCRRHWRNGTTPQPTPLPAWNPRNALRPPPPA